MIENGAIPLRAEELKRLEQARGWIKGHFPEAPDERYAVLQEKLSVVQAILDNDWVQLKETWKLQALGVTFGDALAQKLMMEWVTVNDDYGCDPALSWPGTSILSFPLTLISKRIEQGERLNILNLFEISSSELTRMAFSGHFK